MNRQEQINEFGVKLQELLKKYEVSLSVSIQDVKKVEPVEEVKE